MAFPNISQQKGWKVLNDEQMSNQPGGVEHGDAAKPNRAMKKTPGCLGYVGDEILPTDMWGIIINHIIRILFKQPF